MPGTPTPRRGFPKPATTDPANVPSDVSALATAIDTIIGSITQGTLASRPPTGKDGDVYVARDDTTLHPNGTPYWWDSANNAWRMGLGLTLGTGANQAASGNDARLSDSRTPLAHAASHQEGASDDIGSVPIGAIIPYAGSVLPSGGKWAWADGHLEDRTTYATFFGRVGHAYNGGVDPGSNKVRLPDKRGRVPMGADSFGIGAAGRITVAAAGRGANGGEERHTMTAAETAPHSHPITDPGHGHPITDPGHVHAMPGGWLLGSAANQGVGGFFVNGSGSTSAIWNTGTDNRTTGVSINGAGTGITVNNAGSGSSHQNLQPYEADTYIVRIA